MAAFRQTDSDALTDRELIALVLDSGVGVRQQLEVLLSLILLALHVSAVARLIRGFGRPQIGGDDDADSDGRQQKRGGHLPARNRRPQVDVAHVVKPSITGR